MATGRSVSVILLHAALIVASTAHAAEYFVDPDHGDDANPGSREEPFRSLLPAAHPLAAGDTVILRKGTYAASVAWSGNGTASNPIVLRSESKDEATILAARWQLKSTHHLILEDLVFQDCPGPALLIGPDASDVIIRRCRFQNCPPPDSEPYEKAIFVEGTGNHRIHIEDNVFERPYDPIVGSSYVERAESVNNAEGNQFWVFKGNKVSGYFLGIQLGIGARGDPPAYSLIESNEFFDCNEGVHVKTADNVVRGNFIHDMRWGYLGPGHGIYLRGGERSVVENNRIERAGWAGIRVNGDHHVIRNNLITETPVGVWLPNHTYGGAGRSIWIVHNTVTGAMLPVWIESAAKAHVFNNIFSADQERPTGIFVAGWGMTNPMESWNSAWYRHMAGKNDESGRLNADYNLFHNVPVPAYDWLHGQDPKWHRFYEIYGAHNRQAAPRFRDSENGDFRLADNSPARAAGRTLPNCPADIRSRPRPAEHPDLGAYQGGLD
jgi:hypothetical protein